MADVQVVLLETVPNLGEIGDVRSVAAGYARNFLLPRRLAVHATRQRLDDAPVPGGPPGPSRRE